MDPGQIGKPMTWLMNSFFSILVGWPMMKLNEFIIRRYGSRIKWEINPGKRIAMTLGIVIILACLITFLLNYIFILNIKGASFSEYIKTTLNLLVIQILIVVYAFSLLTAIEFFKLWKQGLIKQESLERKSLELQLEALKNQVNPHFLFNSLNTLTTLVHKDPDLAVNLIIQLSDSYRYLLEQKGNKTVAWSVERQFVENYISLQKMRFGDNLRVTIEPSSMKEFYVVPLSVQMLIENAVKHNVITSEAPLTIRLWADAFFLGVTNNLQVKTSVFSGNIGLENIKQQYELIADRKVEVIKTEETFTVKLPIINAPLSS
jgi:sensor histidine kinase YesM